MIEFFESQSIHEQDNNIIEMKKAKELLKKLLDVEPGEEEQLTNEFFDLLKNNIRKWWVRF